VYVRLVLNRKTFEPFIIIVCRDDKNYPMVDGLVKNAKRRVDAYTVYPGRNVCSLRECIERVAGKKLSCCLLCKDG